MPEPNKKKREENDDFKDFCKLVDEWRFGKALDRGREKYQKLKKLGIEPKIRIL